MPTLSQIKQIRYIKKSFNFRAKSIADILELSEDEVRKVLKPKQKKKPSKKPSYRQETIDKICEEYNIMLANGYKKNYIREELSKWYGINQSVIQQMVLGNYKYIVKI